VTAADAPENISAMSGPFVVQAVACDVSLTGRGGPSGRASRKSIWFGTQINATSYIVLRSSVSGGPDPIVKPMQGTSEICQSLQSAVKMSK
jgi:hypothetical protein